MTPREQSLLLDRLEREGRGDVRRAWDGVVRELRGGVDFSGLVRAIGAGDVLAAVAAIGVSAPLFRDFEAELGRAFEKAGRAFTARFPQKLRTPTGTRILFRFDMRHEQAERWLRNTAAQMITELAQAQRDAIADHLNDALRRGISPRQTALEIAGRINPTTGRRVGGVLGLDREQAGFVRNARAQLLSGDPERMRCYLARKRRDARFDGVVKAAIKAGKPVAASDVEKLTGRYADRLLVTRAERITRSETLTALRAGQHEAFRQGAGTVGGTDNDVSKTWDDAGDGRTRPTHAQADGQTVTGADAVFLVGGYPMRFPGDGSLGAPLSETLNCRCRVAYLVDFIGILARQERLAA